MFTKHCLAFLMIISLLAGVVSAQDAAPTQPVGPNPDQPAAESIYKRIPADCLGFVAAKNLNSLLKGIETFAGQIGMGEQLQAMTPGGLLPMMAMSLQLGEGYNPNGGIALVVMDFEKSGIDVDKMISGENADVIPPIVILLAGKSAETAFPNLAQKDEAGVVTVMLPMGDLPPLQVMQVGDYIALSPNAKALELLKSETTIETAIPAGQKKILTDSDVVLHENVVALSPMIKKIVDQAKAKTQTEGAETAPADAAPVAAPGTPASMTTFLGSITTMLDDVLCVSYGLRFVDDGMMIDMAADYKPDSMLAKMIQAYQPTDKPLMNRLPNLPYIMAGGMMYVHDPEYTKQMMKLMESLLAMVELEMPADLKDRMTALSEQLSEELTGVQFVGGAPKEKGVFGVAMVIECKDADKTKALLPKKVELLTELIQKTIAVKEEDLAELSFTYTEGVEKIGETTVDAVVIDSKKLKELTDEEKKDVLDVLGEETLRFLVAKVDDKTLVVTFGGTTEFLAAVLEAAKTGGTIPADPGVVQALAKLPPQRVAVMVFSPKNMFDTIQAGMKKMGKASDLPEGFAFESNVPLAMTSTVQGTTGMATLYIPSAAVKDIVSWAMAEAASAAAGMMPPPGTETAPAEGEGESDF